MRTVLRALTLLQLDAGQTAAEVASHVQLTSKAVREIGRRYEQGGLERETSSWKDRVNRDQVKINRKAARKKFGYKNNSFRRSKA